jgi:hypothetical protein
MHTKIFAMLLCTFMFVGSAFAGPLASIPTRIATHLFDCLRDIQACDNKCRDPCTFQTLTRDGWVLSSANINTACARKCKRVAVAECLGVPNVIVRLL